MSNMNDEWLNEQRRVDALTILIEERIRNLREQSGGVKGEIIDIRRNFWDDVTINFEDAAETAETHASMKQQAELLSERERSHRHMQGQLATLLRLRQTPYFGRIDLKDNNEPDRAREQIYLGIGSLLDDSGDNYLIYDWRAPVSSLYYDYGPGPVAYETPAGMIEAEMTLKRQFIIRGARIDSMFDTGVTIGDELLQEVLGKQSDAQMKSIVATIQQEQNRIIRNVRARLLIVQGAAGSGKTSAALQRVAYLLYRFRDSLSASQIVLFSPNPMFNSYISTVLPELGEQNMQQTTYQQYLEHRIGASFALEDPFAQMEYTLTASEDPEYEARMAGIAFKSDTGFMGLIDDYVSMLGEAGVRFKSIMFRGQTLIAKEAMAEQFYKLDTGASIPNRIRALSSWLLKELTALGKKERSKEWVDDEIELLDQEAYMGAYEQLQRKNRYTESSFGDFASERDYLAAKLVQEKFKKLRTRVKRLKFLDVDGMYADLFRARSNARKQVSALLLSARLPEQWPAICALTLRQLQEGVMLYEDATPYLYLKERLEGFHTNTTVKHLFIDEAQDYCPFQYHYLKKIFPNCKMTVLGDYNQSIFAHSGSGDGFHALAELYDGYETENITLLRSYRSTKQIVQFTSKIIRGGERIEPFNRNGNEPTIKYADNEAEQCADIAEVIGRWLKEGYASIAVIGKTSDECARMHERLSELCPQLRLIQKETVTFEKGIVIIPAYLAKGVEFDAVAICDASSDTYDKESERKLFYTACTRAMHELHISHRNNLTRFLSQ